MSEFIERVAKSIAEQRLFRRGEHIVIAVSGGCDSMMLLHALDALASRHQWRLTVAHFNHRLRGRSSAADQRLVERTAARLGWPCVVASAEVRAFAVEEKLSLEMAARRLRHAFLARVARESGCRVMALGHHADDQVELFFLRLLRGSGAEGLAGMGWSSPSPADPQVRVVRPLLGFTREELTLAARETRVKYREDASNASLDLLRNRIRHELLPLLERRYQPAVRRVVLRQMEILRAESECLDAPASDAELHQQAGKETPLPVAIHRRRLQRELIRLGIEPGFELVERLRLHPDSTASAGAAVLLRADPAGHVTRLAGAPPFPQANCLVELGRPNRCEYFAGTEFRWAVHRSKKAVVPSRKPAEEWFDADHIGSRIFLRHWRHGDRFEPIGLGRAAKLQDLFTNQKVPRAERHRRVVATTASGEIWWVQGLRIGERFKVTAATRRMLRWRWRGAAASGARLE